MRIDAKRWTGLIMVMAFLLGSVTTEALAMGKRPAKKKSTYQRSGASTAPSKAAATKTTMPSKPATRR